MKTSKVIIIALLVSAYATVSVINIQLAKPKDVSEVTLDMMDIMSRAFDESEGGEGGNDHYENEALRHRTCFPLIWKNFLKCVPEDNMWCNQTAQTTCSGSLPQF